MYNDNNDPLGQIFSIAMIGVATLLLVIVFNGCRGDRGGDGVGIQGAVGATGSQGRQGETGTAGLNGINGQDATPVTVVPLCPGVSSYGTFVEVAVCLNGSLYGVYSQNGGFLTLLANGSYSSNAIGSACNLAVRGCNVTH